jgi:hypothetical protein
MTMTQRNTSIQEAYEGIISEGITPKFKTGDRVGIGGEGNYDPMNFQAIDTGTVAKVDRLGNHHVEFDNKKSSDDHTKKLTHKFDSMGMSANQGIRGLKIIPIDDYEKKLATVQDNHVRRHDLTNVIEQIAGMKNGFGNFPKLSKDHAEKIKSLLDKHTEA